MATSSNGPPSPADNPVLWQGFDLGEHHFPANPNEGYARVSVGARLKVDAQKASGTDKARTKVNGVEPCDLEIELNWTNRIWGETWAFLQAVNPNGPSKGKPHDIRHPWANGMHSVKSVLIKTMSKLDIKEGGQAYSITLGADEWVPAPKVTAGGSGRASTTTIEQAYQAAVMAKAKAAAADYADPALNAAYKAAADKYNALAAAQGAGTSTPQSAQEWTAGSPGSGTAPPSGFTGPNAPQAKP